ncbi:hypothetical protein SAMN04488541_10394 [Thermoflexibacter ruber]|uniref:Uncharacterized protein n=1 Tax=Thermoflexibacter ruber TaxID=1003 RepID=A0A1I2J3Y2_9BACT|nr:hypothetical protein SAMN04488541_10394 [Thermoflexibacter ruber]
MENLLDLQKETSLLKKFSEIHNSIYANDGLSARQALDEMLKVLFIVLFALLFANRNVFETGFYVSYRGSHSEHFRLRFRQNFGVFARRKSFARNQRKSPLLF